MKEIVVMSGKGGTGKTTITAALGVAAGVQAVMADCDVDASNLHLLYQPKAKVQQPFFSRKVARIDYDICIDCGVCQDKCAFDAINLIDGKYVIDEISCEGCAVCSHLCPDEAITMEEVQSGDFYISKSRFGHHFIHARLGVGQDNSGKLVAKVKTEAKKTAEENALPFIIVDGPPGVGCPVISSISGATLILIVTEATDSGLHDMKRLAELIRHFEVPAACVINKYDLNTRVCTDIENFCKTNQIPVLEEIPFSETFYETLQQGKTLLESEDINLKQKIQIIWKKLSQTKEAI